MSGVVQVRELAAWGFDRSRYRPADAQACGEEVVATRAPYEPLSAIAGGEWNGLREALAAHRERSDIALEMGSLDWSLEAINLEQLLSFQRRLVFDPKEQRRTPPRAEDLEELIAYSLGPAKPPVYTVEAATSHELVLRSANPNLQVSLSGRPCCAAVHCGSALIEVASFAGRWFLRDGYHRAYDLLRHGVRVVPAVLIHARSVEELGANAPQFFTLETLFSGRPPRLVDFLDERLNVTYTRPRLIKTLHLSVRESYAPEDEGDLP